MHKLLTPACVVALLGFAGQLLAGCTASLQNNTTAAVAEPDTAYVAGIDRWHAARQARLQQEDGWLALAGLFWLEEGENTFGCAPDNKLVFPAGKITPYAGTFVLEGEEVKLRLTKEAGVQLNGKTITAATVFSPDMHQVPRLQHGLLSWFVIKRGNQYGVRLLDAASPARTAFSGIARYPVQPAWKVEAWLEKPALPRQMAITNVLGQTSQEPSPGTLVFLIDGKEHRLDVLEEGDELFVIFADKTNGAETYGAGRYLYAPKPGPDGKTILDFNKAYNPHCAFTDFATCPLPPRQNFLSIAVPAGEKAYEQGH